MHASQPPPTRYPGPADGSRRAGPVTILIVDEAVAFGGSIVSTANLVRGLDRERFVPVFVTATSEEHVRRKLKEVADTTAVRVARKTLDYTRLRRIKAWIAEHVPGSWLRKGSVYGLYAIRMLLNLPYTLRIAWLIVRYRADIVQLNNGFGNDEVALCARLLGCEPTAFFRGSAAPGLVDRLVLLGRVKEYAAVSRFELERAVADGVPRDRVRVATPSAVAEDVTMSRTDVRRLHSIPIDAPVVGLVGRIVRWKGQLEFLDAAARVMARHSHLYAMLVGDASDGDGEYAEQVLTRVEELGLEDRVVFTGYVDDVAAYYRAMDVVAHASIEPEPSGRVIFEAMANGLPVVASCHGGPPEFVSEGIDGYIVDPRDRDRFADRLERLVGDPELRRSMGENGRRKIQREYDLASYARSVEAVYAGCMA